MKSFWKHLFIDNQDIALIEVGAQNFVQNQINDYNVKHDWVIHAVLSGQGFFQIDGKGYHLKAGDGFILRKISMSIMCQMKRIHGLYAGSDLVASASLITFVRQR